MLFRQAAVDWFWRDGRIEVSTGLVWPSSVARQTQPSQSTIQGGRRSESSLRIPFHVGVDSDTAGTPSRAGRQKAARSQALAEGIVHIDWHKQCGEVAARTVHAGVEITCAQDESTGARSHDKAQRPRPDRSTPREQL